MEINILFYSRIGLFFTDYEINILFYSRIGLFFTDHEINILFYSRIGLFFTDHEIIKANIEKAKEMLDEGGDWDRRNRLKVNNKHGCVTRYTWLTTDNSHPTKLLSLFLELLFHLLVLSLFLELLFHFPANIFYSLIREQ